MAKVAQAFTTYTGYGNREDLSNTIYNIDPFDTPVMSAARRRNVKNRYFDWQTENLPVINLANAQFEGFQNVPDASTPVVRLRGITQISKRDSTVSGSQEESDAAGKSSEMAHQMAMISKVLKSDMESIMCSRQATNSGSGTPDDDTHPRVTESIPHWIGRAVDKFGVHGIDAGATQTTGGAVVGVVGATSGLPVGSTGFGAMTVPTPAAFTETNLNDAMQKAYTNGATPTLMVLPPGPKRKASSFVGRSTTQVLVGKTEVVSTVDVFATDFGRIKAIPSRWLPPDLGLMLDPDYVAVAFFRNFRQYLMARVGDAENRMIIVEWGVEMRNPLAHILLNGIS